MYIDMNIYEALSEKFRQSVKHSVTDCLHFHIYDSFKYCNQHSKIFFH